MGTSTAAEAKEYFAAMDANTKAFHWTGDDDGELIDMAFSKKKVEDRKRWLRAFKPGTFLDHSVRRVRYEDFINKELILFSVADLQRSIPNVMDGLKPSQRKVLFACFKRKLRTDIKVAQLSGYVSEHSAYHHGEASLGATIVGLAQDFVGSNNVNLLVPSGQFGTRLQGGKDHASPRYIFTRLAPLARAIFPEADDALLTYLNDDGQRIEPEFYLPILPLLLVNGADGIGTGWSTSVPNYNPRDIVANLKRMLDGEAPEKMHPWYRGFKGTITEVPASGGERAYVVSGTVRVIDDTTIEVTELPLQSWTQDYKEFLEGLARPEKKEDVPFITDYKEYHTDTCVRFVITLPAENLAAAIASGLEKKFKLAGRISTSNMHAFDGDNHITKYESPEAVLAAFFAPRLDAYSRRRELMLQVAGADLLRLENKMRFILDVVNGSLTIAKRKRAELEAELKRRGYAALAKTAKAAGAAAADAAASAAGDGDDDEAAVAEGASYDYLLSMPLWSLTNERVASLQAEHSAKAEEVAVLRGSTPSSLWRADMDAFLVAYDAAEADMASGAALLVKQQGTFQSGKAGSHKSKAVAHDSDDDVIMEEEDSDDEDFGAKKKKKAPAKKAAAGGGGGRNMMGPVLVPKPCAAADLYEAAKAKAVTALAAAWAAPPKAPRVKGEASAFGVTSLAGGVGTLDLACGADLDDITSPRAAKAAKAAKPRGGGVPRIKAAPKPKKAAFSDVEELSDAPDTDDDDMGTFGMSLAQRLAMRGATGGAAALTGAGAAAAPKAPRPGRAAAAKASTAFVDLCSDEEGGESDGDDDDDDAWGGSDASDAEFVKPPKKAAAAPAPAPAAKKPAAAARPKAKKAAVSESDASEPDYDSNDDFQTAKKPTAAKKPAAAAGAGVARKRVMAPKAAAPAAPVDEEGATPAPKKARKRPVAAAAPRRVDDDDDEVQIVEAPVVAREVAPRRAAAAARKTYVLDDSEDESDGDASDDGDFDGDSD